MKGPRVKNAQKTVVDEHTFDSKMEALRYIELKRLKQAGIVTEIELQPAFELQPVFRKCCGKINETTKHGICLHCQRPVAADKSIVYRADFRVTYADGHQEIEDVKGMETEIFKLKRKMFEYRYPTLSLKVVKGVHR
jgi:hypothetical protein